MKSEQDENERERNSRSWKPCMKKVNTREKRKIWAEVLCVFSPEIINRFICCDQIHRSHTGEKEMERKLDRTIMWEKKRRWIKDEKNQHDGNLYQIYTFLECVNIVPNKDDPSNNNNYKKKPLEYGSQWLNLSIFGNCAA